jgi:hypothetical protein
MRKNTEHIIIDGSLSKKYLIYWSKYEWHVLSILSADLVMKKFDC